MDDIDRFVYTQLDHVIRPEAINGGQLDLTKGTFTVNDNFSVANSKKLNKKSTDHSQEHDTFNQNQEIDDREG